MAFYVSELTATREEILAGRLDGTLQKWRRDVNGIQWFRTRDIHGAAAESEIDDEPTIDDLLATRARLLDEARAALNEDNPAHARQLLDEVEGVDAKISAKQGDDQDEDEVDDAE